MYGVSISYIFIYIFRTCILYIPDIYIYIPMYISMDTVFVSKYKDNA